VRIQETGGTGGAQACVELVKDVCSTLMYILYYNVMYIHVFLLSLLLYIITVVYSFCSVGTRACVRACVSVLVCFEIRIPRSRTVKCILVDNKYRMSA